jgi:hypothetical protein
MPDDARWILSVRLRHPTEDRDLEVRLDTEEFSTVDAVFITVNAVERILIPFYEKVEKNMAKAAKLREEVEEHRLGPICLVFHKLRTSFLVPDIDWNAKSPIRL